MNSLNKAARTAGILYLMITVLAPFSMMYVPSKLIAPEDATATANHILAAEGLFRAGMASDAVIFLLEIVLTGLLYVLLKPVSQPLSLVAAFARLGMTIVQGLNLLNYFAVLLLLSGAGYLTAFAPNQVPALVLFFLHLHEAVVLIWGLFFGLHLLTLGYLVYWSGYMPKLLGSVLVITALCYLTQSFGNILLPQYKQIFATVGLLAIIEIAFPLWLLIKGVKVQQPAATQAL